MTLFKTIIAAANVLSAMYERSVFSYRGTNLRNRLNHECANSTTQRRALNDGSFSINFFSSPRGRMWGMKPHEMGTDLFLLREERWCARRTLPPTIRFLDDLIVKWWRAGRMRKRGSMSFRCLGFCRVRRAHHGRSPARPANVDLVFLGGIREEWGEDIHRFEAMENLPAMA